MSSPFSRSLHRDRPHPRPQLSTEDKEKLWIAIVLCKGEVLNNLSETCTHIIIVGTLRSWRDGRGRLQLSPCSLTLSHSHPSAAQQGERH